MKNRILVAARSAANAGLDMLFPRGVRCVSCSEDIIPWNSQYSLCEECNDALEYVVGPFCKCCGRQLTHGFSSVCESCISLDEPFCGGVTAFRYDGIGKKLVKKLKYDDARYMAEYFAMMIMDTDQRLNEGRVLHGVDALVPVPDHPRRRLVRGFSQSALIADRIAEITGIPVMSDIVVRQRHTRRLEGLGSDERKRVVSGAFSFRKAYGNLDGLRIAIVDDVLTTGATTSELSELLKLNGAGCVSVICAAYR